jgi:hypothetical protein
MARVHVANNLSREIVALPVRSDNSLVCRWSKVPRRPAPSTADRGSLGKPSMTELAVTCVHIHHNLALIGKGRNTEQEPRANSVDGRPTIKVVPEK